MAEIKLLPPGKREERRISPAILIGAAVAGIGIASILGICALARAAPTLGEILEIAWKLSGEEEWHPLSEPQPAYTDVVYRFRVVNKGDELAQLRVAYYIPAGEFGGPAFYYSSPIDLEPLEEGDILWYFGTGAPRGTFDFTWYLFSDDIKVDSLTVETMVI